MHSNENNLNELPTGDKGCVPRSGGLEQAHALSPSLPQGHRADALHRSHPGDGDTAAHATESLARNPLEPTAMPTESLGQPRLATESPANRTPQTGNQAGGEGGRGLRSGAGLSRPAPEALPLDNRHILDREEQSGYVAAHLYLYRRDAKLIRENSCKSLRPGVLADEHRKQVGGGRRKECTDFTLKAQCRLKWWLRNSSIGESVASYAVLTYPLEWPEQWGDWKRHMKLIGQHLRRKGVKGWWGLEFQKRGAPHFNLLLTAGVDREWLMTTWKAVAGEACREQGLHFEAIKDWDRVANYVVQHVGKEGQKQLPPGYGAGVGRWWGKWGFESIDAIEPQLSWDDRKAIKQSRLMRRKQHADARARTPEYSLSFGRTGIGGKWCLESLKPVEEWLAANHKKGHKFKKVKKPRDNGRYSTRFYDVANMC